MALDAEMKCLKHYMNSAPTSSVLTALDEKAIKHATLATFESSCHKVNSRNKKRKMADTALRTVLGFCDYTAHVFNVLLRPMNFISFISLNCVRIFRTYFALNFIAFGCLHYI